MTGAQLLTISGLLLASGIVIAFRALRPAPPALDAALAQLSAAPAYAAVISTTSTRDRWDWLPPELARGIDTRLGVSDADLKIIGWTRSQLAGRKLTFALAGLLGPSLLALVLALLHAGVLFVFPVFIGAAVAAVGWVYPSQEAREKAKAARAEFRSNLESFSTLVAGERKARGSVQQALEEAAKVSGSMPFIRMRRAIETAGMTSGGNPWTELRALADELEVPELRNLADICSLAADGASVYNTLLTSARTLRHAELNDLRTRANEVSEAMSRPLALLVTGLATFVMVPFMLRMFGVS